MEARWKKIDSKNQFGVERAEPQRENGETSPWLAERFGTHGPSRAAVPSGGAESAASAEQKSGNVT